MSNKTYHGYTHYFTADTDSSDIFIKPMRNETLYIDGYAKTDFPIEDQIVIYDYDTTVEPEIIQAPSPWAFLVDVVEARQGSKVIKNPYRSFTASDLFLVIGDSVSSDLVETGSVGWFYGLRESNGVFTKSSNQGSTYVSETEVQLNIEASLYNLTCVVNYNELLAGGDTYIFKKISLSTYQVAQVISSPYESRKTFLWNNMLVLSGSSDQASPARLFKRANADGEFFATTFAFDFYISEGYFNDNTFICIDSATGFIHVYDADHELGTLTEYHVIEYGSYDFVTGSSDRIFAYSSSTDTIDIFDSEGLFLRDIDMVESATLQMKNMDYENGTLLYCSESQGTVLIRTNDDLPLFLGSLGSFDSVDDKLANSARISEEYVILGIPSLDDNLGASYIYKLTNKDVLLSIENTISSDQDGFHVGAVTTEFIQDTKATSERTGAIAVPNGGIGADHIWTNKLTVKGTNILDGNLDKLILTRSEPQDPEIVYTFQEYKNFSEDISDYYNWPVDGTAGYRQGAFAKFNKDFVSGSGYPYLMSVTHSDQLGIDYTADVILFNEDATILQVIECPLTTSTSCQPFLYTRASLHEDILAICYNDDSTEPSVGANYRKTLVFKRNISGFYVLNQTLNFTLHGVRSRDVCVYGNYLVTTGTSSTSAALFYRPNTSTDFSKVYTFSTAMKSVAIYGTTIAYINGYYDYDAGNVHIGTLSPTTYTEISSTAPSGPSVNSFTKVVISPDYIVAHTYDTGVISWITTWDMPTKTLQYNDDVVALLYDIDIFDDELILSYEGNSLPVLKVNPATLTLIDSIPEFVGYYNRSISYNGAQIASGDEEYNLLYGTIRVGTPEEVYTGDLVVKHIIDADIDGFIVSSAQMRFLGAEPAAVDSGTIQVLNGGISSKSLFVASHSYLETMSSNTTNAVTINVNGSNAFPVTNITSGVLKVSTGGISALSAYIGTMTTPSAVITNATLINASISALSATTFNYSGRCHGSVTGSGVQGIPNNTGTLINGHWNGTPVVSGMVFSGGLFTIQKTGWYHVKATFAYAASGSGHLRQAFVRINGAAVNIFDDVRMPNIGDRTSVTTMYDGLLTVGNTVGIYCYQNSGGTLNTYNGSGYFTVVEF